MLNIGTLYKNHVCILITQCLQNSFFLAEESRLCLPPDAASQILVGASEGNAERRTRQSQQLYEVVGNRRQFAPKLIQKGPLYSFLEEVTQRRPSGTMLHMINIRDWHAPSRAYDKERRVYGSHCEAGTWGAEYIEGFERFLEPWKHPESKKNLPDAESIIRAAHSLNGYQLNPKVTYYDVRSDSVFDFKAPESDELRAELERLEGRKGQGTFLEAILDRLIKENKKANVYVAVIGVYSDIKIKTLLIELKARYDIDNLVVSDVLTAAPDIERHVGALDFFDKVLNIEIIHNLNALVDVVDPGEMSQIPEGLLQGYVDFRDYRNYFLDRQKLLSYQDTRILEYVELVGARSVDVYRTIYDANRWLIRFGFAFLLLTLLLIMLRVVNVNVPLELLWISGGLTVAQLLTSFFVVPIAQLRTNIQNLVRLRNYLETYSNITALLRYHLTKVERLQPQIDADGGEKARIELGLVERQIDLIISAARQMAETFGQISTPTDDKKPPLGDTPPVGAPPNPTNNPNFPQS